MLFTILINLISNNLNTFEEFVADVVALLESLLVPEDEA